MPIMIKPLDRVMREKRHELAQKAARLYAEKHSLRKVAAELDVSYETVRQLLIEAKREATA